MPCLSSLTHAKQRYHAHLVRREDALLVAKMSGFLGTEDTVQNKTLISLSLEYTLSANRDLGNETGRVRKQAYMNKERGY